MASRMEVLANGNESTRAGSRCSSRSRSSLRAYSTKICRAETALTIVLGLVPVGFDLARRLRRLVGAAHGALEPANRFAESLPEFGQFLRTEHENRDRQHDQQMARGKQFHVYG